MIEIILEAFKAWLRRLFVKPDWRMVTRIDSNYVINNRVTGDTKKGCTLSFFLYENQYGDRKFDVVDSEEGDVDLKKIKKNHWTYRCDEYRDQIRPWLDGRYDPKIPTYDRVPKDDFQNALAGKKTK